MEKIIVNHPLVQQKLTILRDENTPTSLFRKTTSEIVSFLSYKATKDIELEISTIKTPVRETKGYFLKKPLPIIIPILRAGLGMLEGVLSVFPECPVGFLGMRRDEDTLEIETYAERLPKDLMNRQAIIIDPMLATGNSLVEAIKYLIKRNVKSIVIINILAAPDGINALQNLEVDVPVKLVVGSVDERLNDAAYIVPGLGDAGDRLYGDPGD
jgi:uracil phosphoribosyltransferase